MGRDGGGWDWLRHTADTARQQEQEKKAHKRRAAGIAAVFRSISTPHCPWHTRINPATKNQETDPPAAQYQQTPRPRRN